MIFKNRHLAIHQFFLEFILLNLCITLMVLLNHQASWFTKIDEQQLMTSNFLRIGLILNFGWIALVLSSSHPELYVSTGLRDQLKKITLDTFVFVGITYVLAAVFQVEALYRTIFLLPIFLFSILNLAMMRLFFEYRRWKGQGAVRSRVLVVGSEKEQKKALALTHKIQQKGYGLVGILNNEPAAAMNGNGTPRPAVLGKVCDLPGVLEKTPVDEIFIALSSLKKKEIKHAIETADYYGVRVNLVSESPEYVNGNYRSFTLDDLPVYKLRNTPLDKFNNFLLKKVFDLVFSLLVLVLLSPVFLLIGLLIYLDSGGPILYTPLRKGEGGGAFKCYKFRTMHVCEDPVNGAKSTVRNDPRITRIGKYLRKYDLDELPQFYNVLKGDMSVVGPRPHRVNLQLDFRKIVNDYMVRHYVKPGITGWAQVNGWRGPTQTTRQKKERVRHDLWYIENWSFWLDLRIIFLTVFGRKTRKNAF